MSQLLSVSCWQCLRRHEKLRLQNVADLFEPGAQGIVEQVGVALRGLNLRVAEELADHRSDRGYGRRAV